MAGRTNEQTPEPMVLRPIGFVRSPFSERAEAPRQPYAAEGARGTIELLPNQDFEHALEDLDTWDHIWVIFWFHLNEGWRPKVLPPRSEKRRGLFATRSPYRPNPLGLSVLELESVEGLTLRVKNLDLLDGTPVLDIKPYVPFADAIPNASTGWFDPRDPGPKFQVEWASLAAEQARWLAVEHGIQLVDPVTRTLSMGPAPHPYRRIKRVGAGYRLALKEWRIDFRVEGTAVTVDSVTTGYRARDLATSVDPRVAVHRAFIARFSDPG
jgi:tRNA-Thr(GGU) m(6)t(6)A37 methyltransferase TsaA